MEFSYSICVTTAQAARHIPRLVSLKAATYAPLPNGFRGKPAGGRRFSGVFRWVRRALYWQRSTVPVLAQSSRTVHFYRFATRSDTISVCFFVCLGSHLHISSLLYMLCV